MEDRNQTLLDNFYAAFARHDAKTMAESYHRDARFNDPAFGELRGDDIGAMWKMLIARSKGNLQIDYSEISADKLTGSAKWTARYLFSQTGRKVTNRVKATFEFRDGLIYSHNDNFDFHVWAAQALGWKGWLFGGTKFLQNAVRRKAQHSLDNYKKQFPRD